MSDHLLTWEDDAGAVHHEDDPARVAELVSQHSWHEGIAVFPNCPYCQAAKPDADHSDPDHAPNGECVDCQDDL